MDELFGCTTDDGSISIIAGITSALVREIAQRHAMSPVVAVAVGRLATGSALLGASLKGQERISLQIACNGPLQSLAAEVSLLDPGTVGARAYTQVPQIDLPRNAVGSVDVRHAVGSGHLQVTKSSPIGQPFAGIVALQSGEIDDDIAAYFTQSQQIPGIVALGVVENEGEITAAGGLIAQVMPSAPDGTYEDLTLRSKAMPDIAHMLRTGAGPRDFIRMLLGDVPLRSERQFDVTFHCRCTRERVELALMSLGRDDLLKLADEQPSTEAVCEFCRHVYELTAEDVRRLSERLTPDQPSTS